MNFSIPAWIAIGAVAWFAIAVLVGLLVGRMTGGDW